MTERGRGKALIITFGCRLNIADTALLTARLENAGYAVVSGKAEGTCPDLVVVNSCAVTAEAERKCRQTVRQLKTRFPSARLVVTGCAASLWNVGDAAGADAVLPNPAKRDIRTFLGSGPYVAGENGGSLFREGVCARFPFRSRAFLKIQEGCDNHCAYCIVPYCRGPARSRCFDEVLEDCRRTLDAGFAELVLTGVNTTSYRDGSRRLPDLLEAISALPGEFRIRLSSTEPELSCRDLLDVMRDNRKICRFLHLSLQHGSNAVLKRMNRRYTAEQYRDFALAAREAMPGLSLGTDLIVGFPGETEGEFEEGRNMVKSLSFANTHLFTYSPRPGTPAAAWPRVPGTEVRKRFEILKADADEAKKRFWSENEGRELPVIFEEEHADGTLSGWSDNYLPFRAAAGKYPRRGIVRAVFHAGDLS